MKSYFIFTIVLTVAYLVYYAVIIVQDLYGKKGNSKPEEEVFDLGAPEDEQSVSVTESDTGFNVGNEKYKQMLPLPLHLHHRRRKPQRIMAR